MDAINNILSSLSQDDVESLKSLANSLLSGASTDGPSMDSEANSNFQSNNNEGKSGDSDSPFSSIDPAMIAKIGSIMSKLNATKDDDRIRLISALRPMLSEKRKTKADEAMKIMSFIELLPELKKLNIF